MNSQNPTDTLSRWPRTIHSLRSTQNQMAFNLMGGRTQHIAYQMVSIPLDTPKDTAQFEDHGNLRAGSFAPPFEAVASHRIERRLNTDLPMTVDTVECSSIEEAASCVPRGSASNTTGQMQRYDWYEPTVDFSRQQHTSDNVTTQRAHGHQVVVPGGIGQCKASDAQLGIRPLSSFYRGVNSAELAQYQNELGDIEYLVEIWGREVEIWESECGSPCRRNRRSARIAARSL